MEKMNPNTSVNLSPTPQGDGAAERMIEISEAELNRLLTNWEQSRKESKAYYGDLMKLIQGLQSLGLSLGASSKGKGGLGTVMSVISKPGAFKKLSQEINQTIGPIIEKYTENKG